MNASLPPLSAASPITTTPRQQILKAQLHDDFVPGAYDNWVVWAGALSVQIDGLDFDATLARAYVDAQHHPQLQARVEAFFGGLDSRQIRAGDLDARLWTDAMPVPGYVPMVLDTHKAGSGREEEPLLCEANLVFRSEPVTLTQPGTFSYTAEFSADGLPLDDPGKRWVALNDLAPNQDGLVVVSPRWVESGPTMMEVCLRKLGARVDAEGRFHGGHIEDLTAVVATLPVDVIYLLPFFRPGFGDLHSGLDVRKGELGSPYAVADFFALDPTLVPDPESIDLPQLLAQELFDAADVAEIFGDQAPSPEEVAAQGALQVAHSLGADGLIQLTGRAHLRALTRRAHAVGKRVIFDLVLMQTSRDHALIGEHPEWYVREPDGRPAIHRIAWLEYTDVALLDLAFNEPLQEYLLQIAPYWIQKCDLDGVRIDASQTVDQPFLKRLHNQIHAVRPDALVLGETLCPLQEARDIPVDMIYALFVDFHRDAEHATPLVDFLELMHSTFAAGTVAKAYFENHDSPRASRVWAQRFEAQLQATPKALTHWSGLARGLAPRGEPDSTSASEIAPTLGTGPEFGPKPGPRYVPDPEPADEFEHRGEMTRAVRLMAVAKNLQASLIDASLGTAPQPTATAANVRPIASGGTRLAWALEWGSQWAETQRTDFEHADLLHPEWAHTVPGASLVEAYQRLPEVLASCKQLQAGAVYYHRHVTQTDTVLAATRYVDDQALLVLHNLDATAQHNVDIDLSWLTIHPVLSGVIYDSYDALHLASSPTPSLTLQGARLRTMLAPLQSRFLRLTWVPSPTSVR